MTARFVVLMLSRRYGLSWQIVPTELQELITDPDPGRRPPRGP
jgi:predicted 3-demethylubiquinone-9 3-methyltransferase (glyoxalase superfamily)